MVVQDGEHGAWAVDLKTTTNKTVGARIGVRDPAPLGKPLSGFPETCKACKH